MNSSLTVSAPAKINLGLEILGRRADGYHEIVTVMQAVSIADQLTLTATDSTTLTLAVDWPELNDEDNLALRAVRLMKDRFSITTGARVDLRKSIPVASGLGGASSNAAAALRVAAALWGTLRAPNALHESATELGSDVPFFLRSGAALAEGRGERLTSLPSLRNRWFVIVVPVLAEPLPRKTATLYGALRPSDFSAGDRVRDLVDLMRTELAFDPVLFGNAFSRPLLDLRPELRAIPEAFARSGAPFAALTGAGPAHYTILPDEDRARTLARRVAGSLGDRARVFCCTSVSSLPDIVGV